MAPNPFKRLPLAPCGSRIRATPFATVAGDADLRTLLSAFAFATLFGGLVGCRNDGAGDAGGVAHTSNVASVPTWSISDDPQLVIGDADVPLHRVSGAAFLGNGHIAVGNALEEILYFSGRGELLGKAGRRGSGPGEFQQLWSLDAFSRDSVWAFNTAPPSIAIFDSAGAHARQITLEAQPDRPWRLSDGSWIGGISGGLRLTAEPTLSRARYLVLRFSPDGAVLDTLLEVPGRSAYGTSRSFVSVPFSARPSLATASSRIYVTSGEQYHIDVHDSSGALSHSVRLPLEPRPISSEVLEASRQQQSESRGQSVRRTGETIDPPVPDSAPAIDQMIAAPGEELWVRQYVLPGDREHQWYVLRDSEWVASLRVPAQLRRITQVQRDRVLGIWTDELGVQTVRVYALERSPR